MDKFDGVLTQMVQMNKGYEGFFDSVFGFLRRKTDFYSDHKKAQDICFKTAEKHLKMYHKDKMERDKADKEKQERLKQKQQAEDKNQNVKPKKLQKPVKKPEVKKNLESSETKKDEEKKDGPAPGKILPNKGNGSKTDTYYWTQTLEEVQLIIILEKHIKAKMLDVQLGLNSIHIAKKDGSQVYISGEWFDLIDIDDSTWTISTDSNSKILEVTITKKKTTMTWWDCVIKGEQQIDTQKINPEPSKISDLDGEMKGTVEKMMFDMRQKEKGLPSSDDLQKQDKLKEFMKANPQFDFSKAKFS